MNIFREDTQINACISVCVLNNCEWHYMCINCTNIYNITTSASRPLSSTLLSKFRSVFPISEMDVAADASSEWTLPAAMDEIRATTAETKGIMDMWINGFISLYVTVSHMDSIKDAPGCNKRWRNPFVYCCALRYTIFDGGEASVEPNYEQCRLASMNPIKACHARGILATYLFHPPSHRPGTPPPPPAHYCYSPPCKSIVVNPVPSTYASPTQPLLVPALAPRDIPEDPYPIFWWSLPASAKTAQRSISFILAVSPTRSEEAENGIKYNFTYTQRRHLFAQTGAKDITVYHFLCSYVLPHRSLFGITTTRRRHYVHGVSCS